jgi:nucleotide-binding universal stress UspA family protein
MQDVFSSHDGVSVADVGRPRSARVVVGVHGSPSSLAALRVALQQARDRDAVLVPVLAWAPAGGEIAYRRAPFDPLLQLWRQCAAQRLTTAFEEALGGYPDDVQVQPHVVRGGPGAVLVHFATDGANMLVVGSGHRRLLRYRWRGPTASYCVARAACPVVLVPPPELLHDSRRLTRWGWVNKPLHDV